VFNFATEGDAMKVLAVAPYEGLKEMILALGETEDFELRVEVGDLSQGVALAEEAVRDGVDIIISRGGTAEMIQSKTSIPVVDIEVSGYDMLRALTLVKGYLGKTAIVGFAQIAAGAAAVCEILDIDISAYTIVDEEDAEPTLQQLRTQGYQVIIGDVITVKVAERLGLNGVLLTSGRESVLKAFQQARKMHGLISAVKRDYLIAHRILQEEKEAVVVFDSGQQPVFSNAAYTALGSLFQEYVAAPDAREEILSKGEFSTVFEQKGSLVEVNGYPLRTEEGVLAAFRIRRTAREQTHSLRGVTVISSNEERGRLSHLPNVMVTRNEGVRELVRKADLYRDMDMPVWITGEEGSGRERMAHYIHFSGSRSLFPLMTIDCSLIADTALDAVIQPDQGVPLLNQCGSGTVYFHNIDALKRKDQNKLAGFLTGNELHCRLLASSRDDILGSVERGEFSAALYYRLAEVTLPIPALDERKEDIESLSYLFISEYNAKFGRQLVGLRDEARQEMEQFHWTGNIRQLQQVIEESVLLSKGPYIEHRDIVKILESKKATAPAPSPERDFDFSGTLSDIEQRVIRKIWQEEAGNQARTAERLGINRTTLWRKLKS